MTIFGFHHKKKYFYLKIWFLIFYVLIFQTPIAVAQNSGFAETLSYINSKLGKGFKVNVERGIIIADFFDENNKLFRQDQVNPKDLDTTKIYYDAIEKLFCINCLGGKNKCVDRNLYVNKISRSYSRISFYVTLDNKSVGGLKKAFNHLIKLCTVNRYKSDEPFE